MAGDSPRSGTGPAYIGAALAVLHFRGQLGVPLQPYAKADLDAALRDRPAGSHQPRVLVIGALGRSGTGAVDALAVAGITASGWDVEETRSLDRGALLAHDVLVNTVRHEPVPPFLTHTDLAEPDRRLSVVCDVTCDVTSACNALPVYEQVTTWPDPVLRLREGTPAFDVIAIDNLPSLLPLDASVVFSAQLTPLLAEIGADDAMCLRCAETFRRAQVFYPSSKCDQISMSVCPAVGLSAASSRSRLFSTSVTACGCCSK